MSLERSDNMFKKRILFLVLIIFTIGMVGCTKKENPSESALAFKKDYEAINNTENKSGKIHRAITIPENNPYEEITTEKLLEKIQNKDTFYVYFGSRLCPWCRSVIEKATAVANSKKIEKIYYIDIWDDEGSEILRDKYVLEDKELTKTIDGTKDYYTLLELFANVLSDYTLTNEDDEPVAVGEKRIFAPNFIYIKNGKAVKLTEGISELQTDSREELTDEMLKDEEQQFQDFFNN